MSTHRTRRVHRGAGQKGSDPVEAAQVGTEALSEAGTIRSRRAADDLRELGRYCAPHRDLDAVADLRGRIRDSVQA